MSDNHSCSVLVTGATGMQGAGVVKNLLSGGYHVRALTTDAASKKARTLHDLGAELVEGRFRDQPSLNRALKGVEAVFSLQLTDPSGQHREVIQVKALIEAAKKAARGTLFRRPFQERASMQLLTGLHRINGQPATGMTKRRFRMRSERQGLKGSQF